MENERAKSVSAAIATVGGVAQQTKNKKLRDELEASKQKLDSAVTAINEAQTRALKALIGMGAFLSFTIDFDDRAYRNSKKKSETNRRWFNDSVSKFEAIKNRVDRESDPAKKAKLMDLLKKSEQLVDRQRSRVEKEAEDLEGWKNKSKGDKRHYSELVSNIAADYSEQVLTLQLEEVKVELQEKQSEYLFAYANLFVKHVGDYRKDPGRTDPAQWFLEIQNIKRGVKQ